MCGIFACAAYNVCRTRADLAQQLLNGLRRLEYRGYDSAGICIDGQSPEEAVIIKSVGTVAQLCALVDLEKERQPALRSSEPLLQHVGLAHTRWATHGPASVENAHPHHSDGAEFVVVHNGIITNYKPLKEMLMKKNVTFYSQTDSEVVAKLTAYLYKQLAISLEGKVSFARLVMFVMQHLEGAFALIFRSSRFPNQIVACKRGSPLVIGHRGGHPSLSTLDHVEVLPEVSASGTFDSPTVRAPTSQLATQSSALPLGELVLKDASADILRVGAENCKALNGSCASAGIEFFFASDASALVEHIQKVFYTEDNDIVAVANGKMRVYNCSESSSAGTAGQIASLRNREIATLKMELDEIMRGSFPHFMLKEIFEQPESIAQTMRGRLVEGPSVQLTGVRERQADIRKSNRLIFVACGTSYHACLAARQFVEEMSQIPVIVELACDFLDRMCPIFRSDVVVFVSQSGETADTLEALKYVRKNGALCMGVVNVVGSAISRLTDFGIHLNAGCEIGVASTKAYTSQIVALVLFALELSSDSRALAPHREQVLRALTRLPGDVERTIKLGDEQITRIAKRLENESSMLLVGRGYHYATCLEGALKIKEVAYIHTEGINAGELKHGPLALVDDSMPMILFSSMDRTRDKVHNAAQQLLARGGKQRLIVVSSEDDHELDELFTENGAEVVRVGRTVDCLQPILSILPMQLLSYRLAVARGLNVDQPRNLAKSVTVQ